MLPTYAKVKMTRDGFSQLRLDYNLMGFDGLQHRSRQLHKKLKREPGSNPPFIKSSRVELLTSIEFPMSIFCELFFLH